MEKLSDEEFHELVLYFIERELVDGVPEDYFGSEQPINGDAEVELDCLGNPACSSSAPTTDVVPVDKEVVTLHRVLDWSIPIVESQHIDDRGVYRTAADIKKVATLKRQLWKGKEPKDFLTEIVPCMLKNAFKELKTPFFNEQAYEEFFAAWSLTETTEKVSKLREALRLLSKTHRTILVKLLRHLNAVAAKSETNKMTRENLCIVWGPTILQSGNPFNDFTGGAIFEFILQEYDQVFDDAFIKDCQQQQEVHNEQQGFWKRVRQMFFCCCC